MEKKDERWLNVVVIVSMIIILGLMAKYCSYLNSELNALKENTNDQMTEQQAQMDVLAEDIAGVRDDMEEGFRNQQEQIDTARQVQRNTNSALTRLRKQRDELEEELKKGLELRKQRKAEQYAAAHYKTPQRGSWEFSEAGEMIDGMASAGNFQLTAYEWTGNPCANGNYPTVGYTFASNYFPLGTRLYIEGIGEGVVEDTGGMGNNVVDIYMGDVQTCINFGRQNAEVYILED